MAEQKPMTFAEWFAWVEDIYKTNRHAHDWQMEGLSPDGGVAPVFDPSNKRVLI
jgi:hypothetical protein